MIFGRKPLLTLGLGGNIMFTLFETPAWFAGFDLALDTIAFLVTLIISSYSFKLFRLSKESKFGYFSLAFSLKNFSLKPSATK